MYEDTIKWILRFYEADGGFRSTFSDVWCTYAAVKTLSYLNSRPKDPNKCMEFLLRNQNLDGGFGWKTGVYSDAWSTHYALEALRELGFDNESAIERACEWILKCYNDKGGFGMTPNQHPDLWATFYAVETLHDLRYDIPNSSKKRIVEWISKRKCECGGYSWYTGYIPDMRATFYAIMTLNYLDSNLTDSKTIEWIFSCQLPDRGFSFGDDYPVSDIWATSMAIRSLNILDYKFSREETKELVTFLLDLQTYEGGFKRWKTEVNADIWATYHTVNALKFLNLNLLSDINVNKLLEFVLNCQRDDGGFLYHPVYGSDIVATFTSLMCLKFLGHYDSNIKIPAIRWLKNRQNPNEGGLEYMPARGAEVKCTLLGVIVLFIFGYSPKEIVDINRCVDWIKSLQNDDGGFGWWSGRGSDLESTCFVLEFLRFFNERPRSLTKCIEFLEKCKKPDSSYSLVPRGEASLIATCYGVRACLALDIGFDKRSIDYILSCRKSDGSFSNRPREKSDLISTYNAISLLTNIKPNIEWVSQARDFILSCRNTDGGFGVFPNFPSDHITTYFALDLLSFKRKKRVGWLYMLKNGG